jgi:hypothetical protein
MNQGPSYFGDLDESDEKLLEYEQETEEEGLFKVDRTKTNDSDYFSMNRLGRSLHKPKSSTRSALRIANSKDTTVN